MKFALLNIILTFAWAAMTGSFTFSTVLTGFLLGSAVLFLARRVFAPSVYFPRVWQLLSFLFFFLRELFVATWRVTKAVLTPGLRLQPHILAIPLEATSDVEITLLANFVSLTPGSLSVEVSPDRRILYVHVMDAADPAAVQREIKEGFERRLLTLLRSQPPQPGEYSSC